MVEANKAARPPTPSPVSREPSQLLMMLKPKPAAPRSSMAFVGLPGTRYSKPVTGTGDAAQAGIPCAAAIGASTQAAAGGAATKVAQFGHDCLAEKY